MAAYVIAQVNITDPEKYAVYREMVPPTFAKFGGRPLARGGAMEMLEGEPGAGRVVIVEFPSMEQARAWWASEEYAPAKALRQAASVSSLTLLEGLPG